LIVFRDFHVLSYIHKNLIKIELRELGKNQIYFCTLQYNSQYLFLPHFFLTFGWDSIVFFLFRRSRNGLL
jgi:hypothetical protein